MRAAALSVALTSVRAPQIHNGNLTNAEQLRATLQTQSELSYQRHLKTDSDSEVLLNIFADEIHRAHKARLRGVASGQEAARLGSCAHLLHSCTKRRSGRRPRSASWCLRLSPPP